MKRIEINGVFYRKRRGVLVVVSEEWVGKVTHQRTIRERNTISRRTRKNKNKST